MQASVNFAPMLMKRLSLLATTLRARTNEEKARIRDALLREVWPLIEQGKIKPVIDSVLPLADAQAAQRAMASSAHIGKILSDLKQGAVLIFISQAKVREGTGCTACLSWFLPWPC